ncbi:DUF397 domain-containing protein [Nocardiopsis exhalans]|uniref:DUF397 domain-containing protein n=1 Tax=Nocardiopsis exhalans TaxID=163604 RepID=A0ABY5DGZ4_9ACTN|nr:DUF397 domain-containing protein [Nocardiopsis exhalans]USY22376.1 DUF397 domain-containing protein [Nocardiopsis exhalans]
MGEVRVWYKSSYSSGSGSCVEVAEGLATGIRDTQNRNLGHLDVPATEWNALIKAVTRG